MPTLPDVQDFGARQAPQQARGISQPRAPNTTEMQIYSAPAQIVGGEVSEFAQRQLARQDIVAESNIEAEFMSATEELARNAQTMDLAVPENVAKVGGEMIAKQNELLARHKGSLESRTRLERSLIEQRSRVAGQLGALSAQAEFAKVDGVTDRKLAPLPVMAANDPTMLDDVISRGYAEIDAKAGAYTPEQVQAKKDWFASVAAAAAVQGTISRARKPEDLAEIQTALSSNPGLIEALGPTGFLQMQQEINNQYIGMVAEMNKPGRLIEVADPSSPTGVRYVDERQAMGMAAPGRAGPSVTVNTGETGPTLSKDGQSVLVADPTAPSGFRMVPITGGEADLAAQAAAAGAASKDVAQADRQNVVTGAVLQSASRIFDILEDPGFFSVTGPNAGPLSGLLRRPDTLRIESFLDPIKASVAFDTLQRMREASPTGGALGAVSDTESRLLMSTAGALSTSLDPADLANSLLNIGTMFANAQYGSDKELDLAVEQGDLTQAQATAARGARDQIITGLQQRVANVSAPEARSPTGSPAFDRTLEAVREDPRSFSPEDVASMDFTPAQLRQLGDVYEESLAAQPARSAPGSAAAATADPAELTITRPGGADGQIDPAIIDEIAAFAQATPDAGQYFEKMANILDAAAEEGREMTLEEALAKAKGGG